MKKWPLVFLQSSDDEPDEKKDRFVAELFKFMDDRGTPINKAPNLGGSDLNLFKLFRIVQSMGGYNRVSNLHLTELLGFFKNYLFISEILLSF